MSFLLALSELLNAGAEGIAQHQMSQAQQSGQRTVRRKTAECTPCAAMADVDATRKRLGFGAATPAKPKKLQKKTTTP